MAEQATIVQDGVDYVQDTVKRIQKDVETRRKDLEKRIKTQRKSLEKQRQSFEKQTSKRVNQVVKDLRKSPVVKRAESLQQDLLGLLNIASKDDVQKIDRKLAKLSKALKDLEERRSKRLTAV